ncbi:D-hexose-6-phosphate mutarotase [Azospira sp. I13]|uniref:D-hexose-6-phosphate mutarotase n=1 Tax=Azospira sp. I13 TaxID=1765050 RepID=UPI000D3FBF54|nr:D-hexose-6-phosphate mutarotase [Azospira sp. I13]GBG01307.1 D-hexose-6-phosphate mutarotase [Azospira sp. I13]
MSAKNPLGNTPNTSANTQFHGLDAVRLTLPDGSTAVISAFGAQVLSWVPAGGGERLYLSPKADFSGKAPIRGGVPVIFPQFAERGPLPRHGFARTAAWALEEWREQPEAEEGGFACAVYSLQADEATRALWPHDFKAELTVALTRDRLDIELEVENPGSEALEFTCALHTYLRVKEVENATLTGLHGSRRLLPGSQETKIESGPELMVEDEVDDVYLNVPRPLLLKDGRQALAIASEGFTDVVVWNPWETKCAGLPDMPANGFRHMLCVESAAVGKPVSVAPGEAWWGRQTLVTLDAA